MAEPADSTVRETPDLRGVWAGLFLVVLAGIALWQGRTLDAGTLTQMGPGMLPRSLAWLTLIAGVAIGVRGFMGRETGTAVGPWSIRGTVFVLGAAVLFALTIRPLGLAVAGPCALVLAAFAGREARPLEVLVFAAAMTALCILLFRTLLGLPIPVAPWLLDW